MKLKNHNFKAGSWIAVVLLFTTLLFFPLAGLASAIVTVPTNTYLAMPSYGTNFNFAVEQTFNNLHMEGSTNSTYGEFWFLTLTNDETYGLRSTNTNFTVSTLFTSQTLTYFQAGSGTVDIYCGLLGEPVSTSGSVISSNYNAGTNIFSVTSLGGGMPITVSWTPTPTPPPSPSVSLAINQPISATYTTNDILVSLSASGGTIDRIWFNVLNGSNWVYPTPIIYTGPYFLSGFANGTYTLYASANNTAGNSDSSSVVFSVAIPSTPPQPGLPTVTIGRPQNLTYIVPSIYVALTSTNADAVWYNVMNGSDWVYTYNQTYMGGAMKSGFANGTYTFYAFAANSGGGFAQSSVVFSVGVPAGGVPLPFVDVSNFWLFLTEGNFLWFIQGYLVRTFLNIETAIALLVMLFMVPIYLRTRSLLLLCVLWLLIGSFIIAAFPIASGLAVLFIVLAIAGLLYRLFRGSTSG